MVSVAAALVGLLIGAVINWAAASLPRYAGYPNHPLSSFRLHILRAPRRMEALVEVGTALAFALIWAQTPQPLTAAGLSAAFALLLLIAVTDLQHQLIPNIVVYPLLIAVILLAVGNSLITQADLRPTLVGGVLSFGIFALTRRLKPGSLGGGDVKLAALIGCVFGFPHVLWPLLLGAGSGALVAVWLLLTRRAARGLRIPYAPFLCFGAMIALLYNPITWNLR
ncbi:MAG: prepilin peptidase [Chloroflexi bacterium]|nr:prepilin peptidase [Chloroflexota bacterium]